MEVDNNKELKTYDIDQIAKRGSLMDALDLALAGIRNGVHEDDLYLIAADIAFQLGDLSKAEQLVNKLLSIDPEQIRGWVLFGMIHSKKNDINRVAYSNDQVRTLFPALARFNQKIVEEAEKREPKAESNDKMEVNFDTATYAEICLKQGYLNKALKIYYDLQRKNPDCENIRLKIEELEKRLK